MGIALREMQVAFHSGRVKKINQDFNGEVGRKLRFQ